MNDFLGLYGLSPIVKANGGGQFSVILTITTRVETEEEILKIHS